jgi:hypothetical protein
MFSSELNANQLRAAQAANELRDLGTSVRRPRAQTTINVRAAPAQRAATNQTDRRPTPS